MARFWNGFIAFIRLSPSSTWRPALPQRGLTVTLTSWCAWTPHPGQAHLLIQPLLHLPLPNPKLPSSYHWAKFYPHLQISLKNHLSCENLPSILVHIDFFSVSMLTLVTWIHQSVEQLFVECWQYAKNITQILRYWLCALLHF